MASVQVLLAIVGLIAAFCATPVCASCGSFNGWEDYLDSWQKRHGSMYGRMYPFGDYYCDSNATQRQRVVGFNLTLDFPLHYYGVRYQSLFVSTYGHVAFFKSKSPNISPYIYLSSWPNPYYPEQDDLPFVAPFYGQTDFDPYTQFEKSQLTYRVWERPISVGGDPYLEIQRELIDDISEEIQEAVIGAELFQAKHVILITWADVSFAGTTCQRYPQDTCVRNTYQLVLATDETATFAIYNYFDIKWVGGTSKQLCDPMLGVATLESPDCHAAHAGFNAGEARGFTPMPYSGDSKVADYDILSASKVKGRWLFQIDGDVIIRGGCTNDSAIISSGVWPLVIHPSNGPMLGGTKVDIAGPCFNTGNRLRCRFGNAEKDGIWEGNMMKASCIQPTLGSIGQTVLGVSVDGGNQYRYLANYNVGLMGRSKPEIHIDNPQYDWLNPATLTLSWDPADIATEQATVSIRLWGYREFGTELQMDWRLLDTLASGISNVGAYSVSPASNQCDHPEEPDLCINFDVGAFEVIRYQASYGNTQAVWSQPFPLAWYNKDALEEKYNDGWIERKCQEWLNMDQRQGGWTDYAKLEPCPCTLQQAYMDFGRFQPDINCNLHNTGDDQCRRHQGAIHCVRSTQVTASQGSGNQCCYDASGDLMYSGDSMYGSTADRSHPWGRAPYNKPSTVPTLSHYVWDVVPWYSCCEWQPDSADCFNKYLKHRPTVDCKEYRQPGHASTFGDPHFLTFDGTFYTFNGHGEYWLLMANNIQLPEGETVSFYMQGRFQQADNQTWGETKATHMTAVALQQNKASIITFAVNSFDPDMRKMYVHVDGDLLDFSNHDNYWQEFEDFIIQNNDLEGSKQHSNFTVIYRAGMAVNVAYASGLIHLIVVLPPHFFDKTGGLFGLWNEVDGDDLRPRHGGPPIDPTNTELVHYNFGQTWIASSGETLFTSLYRSQMRYTYYRKDSFRPVFSPTFPPGAGIGEADVEQLCQGDLGCTFDYKVTLDAAVASDTLDAQERDAKLRAMNIPVITCGWADLPNVLKEEPVSYYPGSVLTITGCRHELIMDGPTTYTCRMQEEGGSEAFWDPTPSTTCTAPSSGMSPAVITAIAIPCSLALILIIMGIVVLIIVTRRRRKRAAEAKEFTEKQDAPKEQPYVIYPPSAAITPSTKADPYSSSTQHNNYPPPPQHDPRISSTSDDIRIQKANLDDSISQEEVTVSFDSSAKPEKTKPAKGKKKKKSNSISDPSDVEVNSSTKTKTLPVQPSTVVLGSSGMPQSTSGKKARAPLHSRSADPLPSPPPTPNPNRESMPQLIHASSTGNVIYTPSRGRKLHPQMPVYHAKEDSGGSSTGPEAASSPVATRKQNQNTQQQHLLYQQHQQPNRRYDNVFDEPPQELAPHPHRRPPQYAYPVSSNPGGGEYGGGNGGYGSGGSGGGGGGGGGPKRQPPYVYPRAGYDSRTSPASSVAGARRYDGYR